MLNHRGQAATEMAIFGMLIIAAFSFVIMFSERINRQQSYIMQGFRESLKNARSLKGPLSYTKTADRRMPNVSNPMNLGNQESFSTNNNIMWGNKFGNAKGSGTITKDQVEAAGFNWDDFVKAMTDKDNGIATRVTSTKVDFYMDPEKTLSDTLTKYSDILNANLLSPSELSKSYTYIQLNDDLSPVIVPESATPSPGTTVTETTETANDTQAFNNQRLTKSPGVDTVSTRTLSATDKITVKSYDTTGYTSYDKTYYLGPDGKYHYSDSGGLVRSGSLIPAGR